MENVKSKITYHQEGDYLIPNLTVPNDENENYQIGKYGHVRLSYLKNHKKGEYELMKISCTLRKHLIEVDIQAKEKVKLLIEAVRKMNDELNIPHCIKNYGADSYPTENGFVPEDVFLERLPEIAKNAIADACTGSNPRQPSQEEMEKLLKCCYYDTEVDF